jgi:hypothetical protein
MPYIGNPIYQSAFVTDQFTGNGSTTAFTMSVAPAGVSNVLVAVSGVLQDPSTYSVVGNTLTFTAAPPSGTGNISCRYLGVPASGVTTTAYRTVTEFTATASQTTFTPPSYTVGFINVYLNGVLLGSADYTATNGTTVVLATGASAGNLLTVESFLVSSVLNAIPNTAGSVSASNLAASGTPSSSTYLRGDMAWASVASSQWTTTGSNIYYNTGNVGINTTSPDSKLHVKSTVDNTTNGLTLEYDAGTAYKSRMFVRGNDLYVSSDTGNTGGATLFLNGGTERARINSSGNLLVGASSTVDSERLNVTQSGQFPIIYANNTNATNAYGIRANLATYFFNTTSFLFDGIEFSNLRFRVYSNGGIANYSGNDVNLSDEREKKDIELAPNYLDKICQIPVKTFLYINQTNTEKTLGVVAQDVQAIAPELVDETDWSENADGSKMRLSIYQTDLQYALMKAIQELKAELDSVKAELATLKGAAG